MADPRYRPISLDTMDALRDVSVQAERVYVRLATGRFSTRTGLVRYRLRDLATECRLRPAEVSAAIVELVSAALLQRSSMEFVCYLRGVCVKFAARSPDNWLDWYDEAMSFPCTHLASQAIEELKVRYPAGYPLATRRVPGGLPVAPPVAAPTEQRTENREQRDPSFVAFEAKPTEPAVEQLTLLPAEPAVDHALALMRLWNELCPSRPPARISTTTATHEKAAAAWNRDPDLALWRVRFAAVEASDYYSGRDKQWKNCDLLWAMNRTNAEKLDNRAAAAAAIPKPLAPLPRQRGNGDLNSREDFEKRAKEMGITL